jgi:glycosyltransferase involved in cell wall biosynthesis
VAALASVRAVQAEGGAATAGTAGAGADEGVELVGVAARHRYPPVVSFRPSIGVRQLPLPRPALYETWHALRWPPVEQVTGAVDVVHATTLIVPPRSAPLVVTVHDLAFLHEPEHATRRGLRFFRRGLELVRRDADVVLCSSTATLEDCAAAGIARDRLRLVPLGVHVEPALPEQVEEVRLRHGLDRPFVLFVGTLEPRKNLRRLIRAFDQLDPRYDLVLAGPTGWGEDVAPPSSRTIALGFVKEPELRALYAGADVFVFPSLREGFGLPVLEAMAQGTPVVTSKATSTEEVAGGAAVLVDPHDVDDIARGIAEALDRRDELAAAGHLRAKEMTWAANAAATLAAYREVARG